MMRSRRTPSCDDVFGAGDGAGAGAVENDFEFSRRLADEGGGVQQRRAGDDRGTVLVVVEDRDPERPAKLLFDEEAIRRFDVLEVDAAERGLEELAGADDLLRVLGIELDVEDVDVGEPFEQDALAFHHRLAGQGSDVAKAEDRGAVADDGDEVALGGVFVGERRVLLISRQGTATPGV